MNDRLLVLVRHGQSEWNLKNLFTGWKDVDLTEQGVAEARAAGRKLKSQELAFDVAYTSALKRAQRIAVRRDQRALTAQHAGQNLLHVIGQRARQRVFQAFAAGRRHIV